MKGTMMIFAAAVLLLVVLAWLVWETDPEKQYGSRMACLFRTGAGNLQKMIWQAGHFFGLLKTEGVASYQGTVIELVEAQTKQRISMGKEQIFSADFKKREKYNRKVLD